MIESGIRTALQSLVTVVAIALTGLPAACTSATPTPTTSDLATHRVDERTRRHMRVMSDDLLELAALTADRPGGSDRPDETRRLALGRLERIEREARATSPRFMADLLEDIGIAKSFAKREPPNLVPANRLVQSCLACHRSL